MAVTQDRAQWLAQRATGIGGSDVAAMLGISKWKTPLQLYLEKRGEAPPQSDNDAMRWGRYLEPVVRQAYADETGYEVRVLDKLLRHPRHEFMVANLDGFVLPSDGPRRVFEAKTARTAEGWGEPRSDEIPHAYYLQVQHYLEVTGFEVADVAVLIGGADFRIYEVPADRELQQMIVDACADFWQRVQRGEPPEPVSYADVQARWGRASKASVVVADDEVLHALSQLRDLRKQAEYLRAAEEEWKAVVMRAMGERDTLVDASGQTLCTWKAAAAPQRFDAQAFKAQHPDLYAHFLKPGEPSRRFLLK
jgi:putative phage-type endonuclease